MQGVKQDIKGGKIAEAIRVKSKRDGTVKEFMSVTLLFENNTPESIQLGYVHNRVREFVKEWATLQKTVKERQDLEVHMSMKCEKEPSEML